MTPQSNPEGQRVAPIDFVKAIAIVAVVFNHAGWSILDSTVAPIEKILRISWVGFHVPSFFLVSGFLYYRPSPVDVRGVGRRLRRLLPPYFLASALAFLLGYAKFESIPQTAFALATGGAFGMYYFVFVMSICITCIWPFSRLGSPVLGAVIAVLFSCTLGMALGVIPRPTFGWFWGIRDPLYNFAIGYFGIGWIAARHARNLQPIFERARWFIVPILLLIAAADVGAQGSAFWNNQNPFSPMTTVHRIAYTLSCVGLIVAFTYHRNVPAAIRFLSEASFTIYLYHIFFIRSFLPYAADWNPVVRVLTLVVASLAASSCLTIAGRKVFGRYSRLVLGT